MIDLNETEKVRNAIAENPENVQSIIDNASMGICITNSKGNFVTVNDNYTKIYGYSKEELIGNPFVMVVPEENKAKMQTLHDKFLRDKREISRNWTVQDKNGNEIEISVDTGYTEAIFDQTPHKITFVEKEQ
jgi:two-component system CheB/CheR fusion protein